LAATIPDPFLKHTFSKYVWNRETIGEYILSTILQGEDIFQMILDYEGRVPHSRNKFLDKSQKEVKDSKTIVKETTEKTLATIEEAGRNLMGKFFKKFDKSAQNNNESKSQERPQETNQTSTSGTNSESTQNTTEDNDKPAEQLPEPVKSEDADKKYFERSPDKKSSFFESLLSWNNILTGREQYKNLYADNPRCIYIPCDSFKNPGDKKELIFKVVLLRNLNHIFIGFSKYR